MLHSIIVAVEYKHCIPCSREVELKMGENARHGIILGSRISLDLVDTFSK